MAKIREKESLVKASKLNLGMFSTRENFKEAKLRMPGKPVVEKNDIFRDRQEKIIGERQGSILVWYEVYRACIGTFENNGRQVRAVALFSVIISVIIF